MHHSGGFGQLMGVACKITQASSYGATDQQEDSGECKTATNTNNCCLIIAEKQYKDDARIFSK